MFHQSTLYQFYFFLKSTSNDVDLSHTTIEARFDKVNAKTKQEGGANSNLCHSLTVKYYILYIRM